MASFLSFVYRRQTSAPASFETSSSSRSGREARLSLRNKVGGVPEPDTDAARSQFLPPGVSSSGSSESAWAAPHFNSHDESEDSSFLVHSQDDDDEQFLSSPFTPEGLLPRKSIDSMRRELKLDIPPRALEHSMMMKSVYEKPGAKGKALSGVAKILAGMDTRRHVNPMTSPLTNRSHHTYSDDDDYDDNDEDMILPPPQFRLHSKSTFESSVQSPPVSTSSFYSKQSSSNDRPVAMSPILQVGQARTAVGALVALREAANRHPNASMAVSDTKRGAYLQNVTTNDTLHPPSPSNKVISSHKPTQAKTKRYSFPMSVLPPRTQEFIEDEEDLAACGEDDAPSKRDENENVPCLSLDSNVATPNKRRNNDLLENSSMEEAFEPPLPSRAGFLMQGTVSQKGMVTQLQSRQRYDFHAINSKAPSSPASSKTSLISLGQKAEDQFSTEKKATAGSGIHSPLMNQEDPEPNPYDDNEEEFDGALMARKFRNQQMRKRMVLEQEHDGFENDSADCDEFEDEEYNIDALEEEPYEDEIDDYYNGADKYAVEEAAALVFEDALLRRKARNQRQEKEKFLQEIVARLRDNLDLVADIEDAACRTVATMGSWFVKTPMDSENLLTGFSCEHRNKLLACIDSVLHEMGLAQPEEFIVSPSKVPSMTVSHDTLTQALYFCRALIVTAVPRDEKERMMQELPCTDPHTNQQQLFVWKSLPDLRHALGIALSPQTPATTVRGGGTSLFSLPEESGAETPHTSNVSLATSITSVNTYSARRHQPMRPQLILQQDGLQLRHTVEVVSSLLQKLSVVCLEFGELNVTTDGTTMARKYVLACNTIKQLYLRLLEVKKEDTKALMETFHLESLSSQTGAIIAREVSADEDDLRDTPTQSKEPLSLTSTTAPAYTGRFQSHQRIRTSLIVDRLGSSRSFGAAPLPPTRRTTMNDQPCLSRGMSLFSPSTEDMRSRGSDCREDMVPYEFDDLRRQVGSYDRDDSDETEERDGPCDDGFETQEDTEDWRRMYQNVSLAASSLRSLGQQAKSSGGSI